MFLILRETHWTPENVTHRLKMAGGINRFGEPNYRAVWGWNRLAWIGGKFEEHDPTTGSLLREVVELRQEPKYPAVNRWHIERWVAPEVYGSPHAWYAQTLERENGVSIPALGPYPSRGEYEHCFTLEGPRGEFVQLTPTAAEHIARAIEFSHHVPRSRKRSSIDDRERREDRAYDEWLTTNSTTPCPHSTSSRSLRSHNMKRFELWLKGVLAAAISGGAGGVLTGFAAVGIDPQHFNLQTGTSATLRIAAAAALINAVIGVAAYLQKSPLPDSN